MKTLTIQIDDHTATSLPQLSEQEGHDPREVAARLLARAVRAARPRPVYDVDVLRAAAGEFAAEDEALAESGAEERARLLAEEDAA